MPKKSRFYVSCTFAVLALNFFETPALPRPAGTADCLPRPRTSDRALEADIRKAAAASGAFAGREIVRIVITGEWRIQRDEFSGITKYRTIESLVVAGKPGTDVCDAVPCVFIQDASFFGLFFGRARFRMKMGWGRFTIRLADAGNTCTAREKK
ncbi:MAG: hypothetical protein MUD12_07810 [Spirochaetes bacterium]|nr:hypothetical protein [Spirochaetota bacterium]